MLILAIIMSEINIHTKWNSMRSTNFLLLRIYSHTNKKIKIKSNVSWYEWVYSVLNPFVYRLLRLLRVNLRCNVHIFYVQYRLISCSRASHHHHQFTHNTMDTIPLNVYILLHRILFISNMQVTRSWVWAMSIATKVHLFHVCFHLHAHTWNNHNMKVILCIVHFLHSHMTCHASRWKYSVSNVRHPHHK